MDSGNSESLQSSSGGDEDCDSSAAVTGDSVNAFTSGGGSGPISNPLPPFFDPLTDYLQLHQNSNPSVSLLDPNPAGPRITSLKSYPSNPTAHNHVNMLPSYSTLMLSSGTVGTASPVTLPPQNPNPNQAAACNTKKRSRASRRAPTTVLKTDKTNFRAMVQEFTGIPALPFRGSPSFPRTRLHFFGPSRSDASFDPPPRATYLRRPIAVKINPAPLPFLTSADVGASSSNAAINTYQIPATQSQNVFQNSPSRQSPPD